MRITNLLLTTVLVLSLTAVLFPQQHRDVPAEVNSARQALQGAYNDLQHAGGQWGGHRVNAMHHIEEAIKELNEAEKWAKEHHEIK